jgi:hypothetical protein
MIKLSDAAYEIDGQPMFKVLDKVQKLEREGKKILHFELGEPDFDTPDNIINVCVDALKSGDTHYTNSMGLFELREAVAETTFKSRGFKPNIDQILLKHFTPEAKTNQEIKGIDQFIEMYAQAERPIILAGNGVRLSGSVDKLRVFANKNNIPCVVSYLAKLIIKSLFCMAKFRALSPLIPKRPT